MGYICAMRILLNFSEVQLSDLQRVAAELLHWGEGGVVAFYGGLGAGKTTLVAEVVKALGGKQKASSPTFSLVQSYDCGAIGEVYHFDFFRLKHLEEALDLGADAYFYSGSWCFVEWPELVEPLLPEKHLKVRILHENTPLRQISFERHL